MQLNHYMAVSLIFHSAMDLYLLARACERASRVQPWWSNQQHCCGRSLARCSVDIARRQRILITQKALPIQASRNTMISCISISERERDATCTVGLERKRKEIASKLRIKMHYGQTATLLRPCLLSCAPFSFVSFQSAVQLAPYAACVYIMRTFWTVWCINVYMKKRPSRIAYGCWCTIVVCHE
jgi:hypothetical protein